ncbi:MAG TPA: hypothetical protein VMR86_06540 [Myxococcota bacterium]|nr:hypothetical protein [Myxococcota bacterium]
MVKARKLSLALLSAGFLLVCRPAGAQVVVPDDVANCQWFKITASASGYEYKADAAGLGSKRSVRATCYMQLVYVPSATPDDLASFPYGRYAAPLLCQTGQGAEPVWEATGMEQSFSGMKLADLNVLAADNYLSFKNAGGDVIQGYGAHRILIKVDPKTGAFKSATFQTLGGEMIDGSMFFESFMTVVGGWTAKGATLPVAKVPLEAQQLVAGGMCPAAPAP